MEKCKDLKIPEGRGGSGIREADSDEGVWNPLRGF